LSTPSRAGIHDGWSAEPLGDEELKTARAVLDELTRRMTAIATSMEAQGIVYDVEATQFYQGVTSGGLEQGFEYGGKCPKEPLRLGRQTGFKG
jgi:hypothetical protein